MKVLTEKLFFNVKNLTEEVQSNISSFSLVPEYAEI